MLRDEVRQTAAFEEIVRRRQATIVRSLASMPAFADPTASPRSGWSRFTALAARWVFGRNFYCGIAFTVALVVAFGFGRTVDARLFHADSPRPVILYVHVAMFTGWVVIFVAQVALVRFRRVAWHKRLGIAGGVLGSLMPIVGGWAALVMTRLHRAENHSDTAGEAFLIVSFFDMVAFAFIFGLAIYWRRRPEYHRRLMLMATCGLTVAAFARFPHWLVPDNSWYVFVDALILLALGRDLLVMRRAHPVYLYGLPALILGQTMTMWIYLSRQAVWLAIAHALLR